MTSSHGLDMVNLENPAGFGSWRTRLVYQADGRIGPSRLLIA